MQWQQLNNYHLNFNSTIIKMLPKETTTKICCVKL